MVGRTLGHYEIIEPLGAGGMGEVYLGEDTRLGRKVAIKVLPAEFASDPERLARFEQEARAAAALNHPHIAVVHDLGCERNADGGETHFMVQEYLEGQSLRQRLDQAALPLNKALAIAIEVGEALIVAHTAGIIHRDLKPDNIFVTDEGHAKVLDFGLAKLTEASPVSGSASMSPTLLGTVAGQIMGTAGYMAPEQINGLKVDHRADLFAFGCVLYRLVTGRQAFAGKNVHDTLAKILADDPEPASSGPMRLPTKLEWMINKCLARDPSKRYQHADDLTVDLREIAAGDLGDGAASADVMGAGADREARNRGVGSLAIGVAAAATILGLAVGWWLGAGFGGGDDGAEPIGKFSIDLSADGEVPVGGGHGVAVSPNGESIVYRTENGLFLRRLGELDATLIPGTAGGSRPFFSPDSEWLGFSAAGNLKKVRLDGGQPLDLVEGPSATYATWGADDTIIFGQGNGLARVHASGEGDAQELAMPDPEAGEIRYYRPEFLPGDRAVVMEIERSASETGIAVLRLDTGEVNVVIEDGKDPVYLPTGHLAFGRAGALYAAAFDLDLLDVVGPAVPVVEDILIEGGGATQFSVSRGGTLAYLPGAASSSLSTFVWVSRDGIPVSASAQRRAFRSPRLSSDGSRVAFHQQESGGANDIWVLEFGPDTLTRITREEDGADPIWGPGEEYLTFVARSRGTSDLHRVLAAGGTEPEELGADGIRNTAGSWSMDGRFLAYSQFTPEGARDVLVFDATTGESETVVGSPFNEHSPKLSPDGRWIAFVSDVSGLQQVYVQAFPGSGGERTVSPGYGEQPVWSRDGRELFYSNGTELVAAIVDTADGFRVLDTSALFSFDFTRSVFGTNYDVDPDGERFLMIQSDTDRRPRVTINVVLNWFEELRELVPTNGQ